MKIFRVVFLLAVLAHVFLMLRMQQHRLALIQDQLRFYKCLDEISPERSMECVR